jgi:hypothetical protein
VKKAERERGNGEVGVKKSIKEILFLSWNENKLCGRLEHVSNFKWKTIKTVP